MRVACTLPFKPDIGTSVQSLNTHLLQVTVDRLNRIDDTRAIRWRLSTRLADEWSPGARAYGRSGAALRSVSARRLASSAARLQRHGNGE
ncbi:MAG: hypothetical protein J7463_01395 [Roseiflexus sp.]|nr:hypothetical protein [Roseiflexus sp.]MBO9366503.1 hypothetical protein [Roseiflexus sp.]MBO9382979.1 hypothetical protein [Roseiflexus sp.]MBO9391084.1 hypothetical protein [Roseiflexus sp.]